VAGERVRGGGDMRDFLDAEEGSHRRVLAVLAYLRST
jgi:hypothetical protein